MTPFRRRYQARNLQIIILVWQFAIILFRQFAKTMFPYSNFQNLAMWTICKQVMRKFHCTWLLLRETPFLKVPCDHLFMRLQTLPPPHPRCPNTEGTFKKGFFQDKFIKSCLSQGLHAVEEFHWHWGELIMKMIFMRMRISIEDGNDDGDKCGN